MHSPLLASRLRLKRSLLPVQQRLQPTRSLLLVRLLRLKHSLPPVQRLRLIQSLLLVQRPRLMRSLPLVQRLRLKRSLPLIRRLQFMRSLRSQPIPPGGEEQCRQWRTEREVLRQSARENN
jgi:hypothetical protein